MTKTSIIIICGILVIIACLWSGIKLFSRQGFSVSSTDIVPNQLLNLAQVYNSHGCNGQNISPELSWSNAPQGSKSFAIICHDPDAPHPTGWYHWLVVNIPATVSQIASGGQISGALETITDFQQNRYGGACPPVGHGIHHYNFTVYALDVQKLDVTAQTPPVEVEKLVKSHSLAQATITGLYERR